MTGQCNFLRKFPNFLRTQGYPLTLSILLSVCQSCFPAPSIISQPFAQFQIEEKGLTDMAALWVLRQNQSAVRKDPNYCSLPCPKKEWLSNVSTTKAHPHWLQPRGRCQQHHGLPLTPGPVREKGKGPARKEGNQIGPERRTCWW